MGLYDSMETSTRLETEGIWLDLDHSRIKLARAGGKNKRYIGALEKIMRENKRTIEQLSEEASMKLFIKLYAEIVILDWLTKDPAGELDEYGATLAVAPDPLPEDYKAPTAYKRGVGNRSGGVSEFNVVNVTAVLNDLPDLMLTIKQTAEDAQLYRKSLVEGIAGN